MLTKWAPVLYANYYAILREVAQTHGYALAVHGSFVRDLDLLAVPWVEAPRSPQELVNAFVAALGIQAEGITVAEKPHGRRAYSLPTDGGTYVDLSIVLPRTL